MIKKVKRKRNLKRKVKIIFILIIILIIIALTIITLKKIPSQVIKNNKINKEKLITNILNYQLEETIDKDFLKWITEEYSIKTLEKLENYLKEFNYNPIIWHQLTSNSLIVLKDKYNGIISNRIKELMPKQSSNEVTLSFVGDVSLADDWYIMPKYDERERKVYGILSEDVVNIMTSSDIMVANNEFTISNRGSKMPNKYYTFRGIPER